MNRPRGNYREQDQFDEKPVEHPDSFEEALMIAFEIFQKQYKPAQSIEDADMQMSSSQLCTVLSEFCMQVVKGSDLVVLMRDNGYNAEMIEGRVMWLLRQK